MKSKFNFFLIFIITLTLITSLSRSEEIQDVLVKKIDSFSVASTSLVDSTIKLMKEQKLRICIEEVPYDEQKDIINFTDSLGRASSKIKRKEISLQIKDATVKQILDILTSTDTDYIWELDENQVINILPRDSKYRTSYLEWTIQSFDCNTMGLGMIVNSPDDSSFSKLLVEHNIRFTILVLNTKFYKIVTRPISIHLEHPIIARKFLNRLVYETDASVYWHLTGSKTQRELNYGKPF